MSNSKSTDWKTGAQAGGWGVLLVAGAVATWLGIIATRPPLVSPRPPGDEQLLTTATSPQTVPARLWQDPLKAVYGWSDTKKGAGGLPFKKVQEAIGSTDPNDMPTLLLPVFMSSQPYAEIAENRLRTRYAVLAALGAAGYVPMDRQHLGFFAFDGPSGRPVEPNLPQAGCALSIRIFSRVVLSFCTRSGENKDAGSEQGPLLVPFEWYKRAPGRVLVLWLDEDRLGPKPLARLGELVDRLRPQNSIIHVAGLGPTNSNVLLDMQQELRGPNAGTWWPENARLYSPWATISRDRIRAQLGVEPNLPGWLVRTIPGDRATCDRLAHELGLRDVLPGGRNGNHIVLVSEWDTLYGQSLPDTFVASVHDELAARDPNAPGITASLIRYLSLLWREPNEPNEPIEPNVPNVPNVPEIIASFVHRRSYLRGIDGRLPGETPTEDTGKSTGAKTPPGMAGEPSPEGRAQSDYLRRLEQDLHDCDAVWRAAGGRLRAIGVLGSDVYDKLLILRALRTSFPGVTFFTTDLDARMLHPSELAWTRNLIVASPFGLQLRNHLQRAIAPFRDSYQTSVFFATLQALGCADRREGQRQRDPNDASAVPPRIFELGRSGAYDLDIWSDAYPHPPSLRVSAWLTGVHWRALTGAAVLLALLLISLWPSYQGFARDLLQFRWNAWRIVLLVVLPVAVLVRWAVWAHNQPDEEPLLLLSGISAWPTELLRLCVCLLSAACSVLLVRHTGVSARRLTCEYFDSVPPRDRPPRGPASLSARLRSAWRFAGPCAAWRLLVRVLVRGLSFAPPRRSASLSARLRLAWRFAGPCAAWRLLVRVPVRWLPFAPPRVVSRKVEVLWQELIQRRTPSRRWARVLTGVVMLAAAFVFTFFCFGTPLRPIRGVMSMRVDLVCLVAAILAMLILLILVADVSRLCDWFIRHLFRPGRPRKWRPTKLAEVAQQHGLRPEEMNEWLSIRLVADYTSSVDQFIYGPFTALFIMMISRHAFLDAWDWPIALVAVLAAIFLVTAYTAVVLRWSAKGARSRIVKNLRETADDVALGSAPDEKHAARLRQLADEIEREQRGAFSQLQMNPVLRAALIPSGGMGVLAVIDHFAKLA